MKYKVVLLDLDDALLKMYSIKCEQHKAAAKSSNSLRFVADKVIEHKDIDDFLVKLSVRLS